MAEPSQLFKTISVEPDPPQPNPQAILAAHQAAAQKEATAIKMIQVALSSLWQQYTIALANLFTLASGGSCFVLWLLTPDPNTKQLVALGMYAGFVLAANMLVLWSRRK
jgi:hypothetical protein